MSKKMKQLFEQIQKLPQVPEVVKLLIQQLNDPNIELSDVAANVSKDQVISLKVLKVVNSAAFGIPRKIASIDQAVVLIGMGKLKSLVIASGIVGAVPAIENFDVKQFWLRSFDTANFAKYLADAAGEEADIAFTAGLISGLGNILIQMGPVKERQEMEKRISKGLDQLSCEKKVYGFSNNDVCAELCRRWKFSDDLITPVEQCGEPLQFDPISKLACIIALSRYLSDSKHNNLENEAILASVPDGLQNACGFSTEYLENELESILNIDSGMDALLD